ncbi:DUF3592 domain-containing protein [Microbulbifer agarilyticus]|uniref:DUF3592 domain-containing protein n=1 Tax=Microbulbifer agarilyticus TaxID=260552 RepID=UPI001C989F8C|nr:DUF3592 domain-containing protein [Microbulbifer agarilyticus]
MAIKRYLRLHWQNIILQIGIYLSLVGGWDVLSNGPMSDVYRELRYSYSNVTEGHVSLAEIVKWGRGCSRLKVFYTYTVSERTYTSNIIKNSDSCTSTVRMFDKLKAGDSVAVYYDDSDHSASILDPEPSSEIWSLLILLYIVGPGIWLVVGLVARPR